MPILISEDSFDIIEKILKILNLHCHINTEVTSLDKSSKFQIIQLIKKQ